MKIHIVSDSFKVNSGFGIVAKNIALGLKKLGHNVGCSGFQTSYTPEWWDGIKIYPLATDKPENLQFISNLIEENPDLIIYIGDMYTDVAYLAKIPLELGLGKRMVVHCPIEGSRIPVKMVDDLKEIVKNGGIIIPQSEYGKREMEKYGIKTMDFVYHGYDDKIFKKLDLSGNEKNKDFHKDFHKDYLSYCYYDTEIGKMFSDSGQGGQGGFGCGLCNQVYKELNDKKNCPYYKEEEFIFLRWVCDGEKEQWTEYVINPRHLVDMFKGKEVEGRKRFVYLFIGANISFRKRPERLMEAYAKLIESSQMMKDRVWLHIHTVPNGTTGFDLLEIADELGIKENISFSYGIGRSNNMSDEAINILLNMGDCFVSATSSEGMSINHLLAMSTGLPIISPDNTVITELLSSDRGLLVKNSTDYRLQDLSKRSLVDIDDLCSKMEDIYIDKELRNKLRNNAMKWVKDYTWEKICNKWNEILKQEI